MKHNFTLHFEVDEPSAETISGVLDQVTRSFNHHVTDKGVLPAGTTRTIWLNGKACGEWTVQ